MCAWVDAGHLADKGSLIGEGCMTRRFCWDVGSKMASMELLATGGQSGRTDVPTLGQTSIKAEGISRKHRSDSCDLSVSVSAIHAPSVPLRCRLGLL